MYTERGLWRIIMNCYIGVDTYIITCMCSVKNVCGSKYASIFFKTAVILLMAWKAKYTFYSIKPTLYFYYTNLALLHI